MVSPVEFKNVAQQCGATQVIPTSHSYIARAVGQPSGVCYGISAAWLCHLHRQPQGAPGTLLGHLHAAAAQSTPPAHPDDQPVYVAPLLDAVTKRFYRHQLMRYEPLAVQQAGDGYSEGSVAVFFNAGLARDKSERFEHGPARLFRVGVTLAAAHGYYMINLPNHSIAFANQPGTYRFLDPNFGEVVFASARQFVRFFPKFMTISERLTTSYKARRPGAAINGPTPRHRSWHIQVDRYRPQ